jgi:hypothetical protein
MIALLAHRCFSAAVIKPRSLSPDIKHSADGIAGQSRWRIMIGSAACLKLSHDWRQADRANLPVQRAT